MEHIPENDLLEFNPNMLQNIRKQYNFEKPGDMDRAIDILDLWIKKQRHFMKKEFPRSYLENMIMTNKGSIERAKNKLDKICTFRTIMPDFFGENLTKNNFGNMDELLNVILPKQTDSNHRVYILKNIGKSFTSEQFSNYYKYIILICEYLLAYDCSDGLMIIMDYTDANLFEVVKALNLVETRQIVSIITEGFGMRIKGIHLISTSKAVETLVTLLKQVLTTKLGERICVHKDISTVYQYIPKDIMPSEYGGKEKSLRKLRDEVMDKLTSNNFVKYIEEMNQAKTDESCRQSDKFNEQYMGMPGSFRVLSVD
ncbi:alpha-tocopherol transfer protein-like [Epargyreus clarus]|uniref:alpha-tocopherol transfer protein-like n=1 Tax=Epargyreus clarus TaxID=520877 RepID=UPI003C2F28A8